LRTDALRVRFLPWLPQLVRRTEAGEIIIDNLNPPTAKTRQDYSDAADSVKDHSIEYDSVVDPEFRWRRSVPPRGSGWVNDQHAILLLTLSAYGLPTRYRWLVLTVSNSDCDFCGKAERLCFAAKVIQARMIHPNII
jgi:hypothetical protein